MDYTNLNERVNREEQFGIIKVEKSATYCKPFKYGGNCRLVPPLQYLKLSFAH